MSDLSVFPIPAFSDNYIWCISKADNCVVVDPGDAAPVIEHCKNQGLTLTAIIITHHHWDHTGGIETLLKRYPGISVYGPYNDGIKHLTQNLQQDDSIHLNKIELSLKVIEVPGHTLDHIAYLSDIGLFCGDTLFSAGCGRLFEGTPAQMNQSLKKLMQLPDELPVYCTHEYTLANLEFANAVEPENQNLQDYSNWAHQKRRENMPTLPSTIGQQKAINPFLRTDKAAVIASAKNHMGNTVNNSDQVFAAIRGWKDNF